MARNKKQLYRIELTVPITTRWAELKKAALIDEDSKLVNEILRANIPDDRETRRVNAVLDNAFDPNIKKVGDVDYQALDDWEHHDDGRITPAPKFRIELNIWIKDNADWGTIVANAGKTTAAARKARLCAAYKHSKNPDAPARILKAVHGQDPTDTKVCP